MDDDVADNDAIRQVGVFDAHCHPTDIMASIKDIASMDAKVLTVMATRSQDQQLVVDAANTYPIKGKLELRDDDTKYVVPAFGWHPWFSYQMFDDRESGRRPDAKEHYKTVLTPVPMDDDFLDSLPDPQSLATYLADTERRLEQLPLALVGEVGLDRAFRLPYGGFIPAGDMDDKTGGSKEEFTPGSREGRPLSPHRVSLDHQKLILRAQFELAGKLRRAVSVHSVQTHGAIFDLLQDMWKGHERPSKRARKRRQSAAEAHASEDGHSGNHEGPQVSLPFPPRICMHSYSGPPDALKQFLAPTVPADIYFSFSKLINFSSPSDAKVAAVIKAVPDDRILVESDLHCAGERMDGLLKDVVKKVCEIKGWNLKIGAERLKHNWEMFVFG